MIATIDVGLKNLALCVMKCTDPTDFGTYGIELWDVFNTLGDDDHICKCLTKQKKECGKKAMYFYNQDNTAHFTCKLHFPKTIKLTRNNTVSKKKVDDFLLQDIAKIVNSKLEELYNTYNTIFTSLTAIYIELQPKVNAKMCFTSHIIYGKLVDLYKDTNVKIRFVRAAQKLKAYTGPKIECSLKGEYAKRKWLSIQYTKWFLETKFSQDQKDKWIGWLDNKAKCDDACDGFLMAINALHGIPKKQFKHKNGNELK